MSRIRVPTAADLARIPPGDRGPRLRAIAADYGARLAHAEKLSPSPEQRSRVTHYRRALAKLARLGMLFQHGEDTATWDEQSRTFTRIGGYWGSVLT